MRIGDGLEALLFLVFLRGVWLSDWCFFFWFLCLYCLEERIIGLQLKLLILVKRVKMDVNVKRY